MAAPIPTIEPTTAVAGDTISWTRAFPDYPANQSWILTYAFRLQDGSAPIQTVTATTFNVTDFAATILAAESAIMPYGAWAWAAYVTKAAERHSVGSGTLQLQPNLAKVAFDVDLRTPVKIAYDNALLAWQGVRLGQTVILNGRTYTQHNLRDLIVYVDRCKADYANELQAAQFASTGINPRKIGVRLTRV
jgi:hypothetical protein